MNNDSLPGVKILAAFRPEVVGATPLVYPNMQSEVLKQGRFVCDRWRNFEHAETMIDTLDPARALALFYAVKTAQKLNLADTPEREKIWAERFTQSSIELYGAPEIFEVQRIVSIELAALTEGAHRDIDASLVDKVIAVYGDIADPRKESHEAGELEIADIAYRNELYERYGDVLAVADEFVDSGATYLDSPQLKQAFDEVLRRLALQDPAWQSWRTVEKAQANLEVSGKEEMVFIGMQRAPMPTTKLKGIIAHEMIGHALTSVNATKNYERLGMRELPLYLDFGEGIAVMNEYVISGEAPQKIYDRYVDVALALGIGRNPLSREELYDFYIARSKLRSQISGEVIADAVLWGDARSHVDRIFRGTKGTTLTPPAVFTKDILYYKGFSEVRKYISAKLSKGVSMQRIFNYLTLGKIDATNPYHVQYLADHGFVL